MLESLSPQQVQKASIDPPGTIQPQPGTDLKDDPRTHSFHPSSSSRPALRVFRVEQAAPELQQVSVSVHRLLFSVQRRSGVGETQLHTHCLLAPPLLMMNSSQDPFTHHLEDQTPLGKATEYVEHYDPSLLAPVPRKQYSSLWRGSAVFGFDPEIQADPRRSEADQDLEADAGPPVSVWGFDRWTGYELSWLNPRGLPRIAAATFDFPHSSPSIVESKSFKLYLNSLNQTQFQNSDHVIEALQKDLRSALFPSPPFLSLRCNGGYFSSHSSRAVYFFLRSTVRPVEALSQSISMIWMVCINCDASVRVCMTRRSTVTWTSEIRVQPSVWMVWMSRSIPTKRLQVSCRR